MIWFIILLILLNVAKFTLNTRQSIYETCLRKDDIFVVLDVERWYMFNGDFLPRLVTIFNKIHDRKCHRSISLYNFFLDEWIKVDNDLTHSFLLNRFAGYTPPDNDQVADFLSQNDRLDHSGSSKSTSVVLLIIQRYKNARQWVEKLKGLNQVGYTVIIASDFILHSNIFEWLPKNRFMFLSIGRMYENAFGSLNTDRDPYLGKILTKTIIDLLLNPNHDRFKFLKNFKTKYLGCRNDTTFLIDNQISPYGYAESSIGWPRPFYEGAISYDLCPSDILLQLIAILQSKVKVPFQYIGAVEQYAKQVFHDLEIISETEIEQQRPSLNLILESFDRNVKINATLVYYEQKLDEGQKFSKSVLLTADDLLSDEFMRWVEEYIKKIC